MKLFRLLVLVVLGLSAGAFAQCAAFPCVVASVSLPSQHQTIPFTPLLTPATSGVYRISVYMTSAFANGGTWSAEFNWRDDRHPSLTKVQIPGLGEAYSQTTTIVRAVAGYAIGYQVNESNSPQFSYDLFITVEQLQ